MKISRVVMVLAAWLGLVASTANATVWTSNISYDGIYDEVNGRSVSVAIDNDNDGYVTQGDSIVGMIVWEQNTNNGPSNFSHWTVAVFAADITSGPGPAVSLVNGLTYSLTGNATLLGTYLPGLAASVGGFQPGTMGLVASSVNSSITDPSTQNLSNAVLNLNSGNWILDLELGMVGNDFFNAELKDNRSPGTATYNTGTQSWSGNPTSNTPDGKIATNEYSGQSSGNGVGYEAGGFTLLADHTGPGISNYQLLQSSGLDGSNTGFYHQIVLMSGTQLKVPTTNQVNNGWNLADTSVVQLNAVGVPEPSTVGMWMLGACALMLNRLRKRNRC